MRNAMGFDKLPANPNRYLDRAILKRSYRGHVSEAIRGTGIIDRGVLKPFCGLVNLRARPIQLDKSDEDSVPASDQAGGSHVEVNVPADSLLIRVRGCGMIL